MYVDIQKLGFHLLAESSASSQKIKILNMTVFDGQKIMRPQIASPQFSVIEIQEESQMNRNICFCVR